jgi:hypothetical protein
MQKFLIGPDICGASVSFGALCYLIRTVGDGLDLLHSYMKEHPDEPLGESSGKVGYPALNLYSPLLTQWFEMMEDVQFSDVRPDTSLHCLYGAKDAIRDSLLPFVERLEGDYTGLDAANNGSQLRIVEVPDGYFCGVTSDSDTGSESVQEYSNVWNAMDDREYRALNEVRKFCNGGQAEGKWPESGVIHELGSAKLAVDGDLAVARIINRHGKPEYMFLSKNHYYCARNGRPAVLFEVEGMANHRVCSHTVFRDNSVETYARLVLALSGTQEIKPNKEIT